MCLLLETIRLEDGVLFNLHYHNRRFNAARRDRFGLSAPLALENIIRVPENATKGLFRCRVLYSEEIQKIEFIPYVPRRINSLKLVVDDHLEYACKFADRHRIDRLFAQRGSCDEIIIIKNGRVTDCSIGNLVFYDGENWFTPSSPLLNGTRRMQLLEKGLIREREITAEDVFRFRKAGIINAFFGLENLPEIPVRNIQIPNSSSQHLASSIQ